MSEPRIITEEDYKSFRMPVEINLPNTEDIDATIKKQREIFSRLAPPLAPPPDVMVLRFSGEIDDLTVFHPETGEKIFESVNTPDTPLRITQTLEVACTLWADKKISYVVIGGPERYMSLPSDTVPVEEHESVSRQEFIDKLIARNKANGDFYPPGLSPYLDDLMLESTALLEGIATNTAAQKNAEIARVEQDFPVFTTQEIDAICAAQSDGKFNLNFTTDIQAKTRTHRIGQKWASHIVRLSGEIDELERLTAAQDADGILSTFYVCRLLAPPSPLPSYAAPTAWIDFDNIIKMLGWTVKNTAHRRELQRKVYDYLKFGEMAWVSGERSVPYKDPDTGELLPTRIDAPLWRIGSIKFLEDTDTPLCARLFMSPEWVPLLQDHRLAQYLPTGELLGSIPGDQPSGSWARCAGIALSNHWRRQPRKTLELTHQPTREELLTRYMPKKAPPKDILESKDPSRALEYWFNALALLVDKGIVEMAGEAAKPLFVPEKRQQWAKAWLKETVDLRPGPKLLPAIQSAAESSPPDRPRNLQRNYKKTTKKAN